MNRQIVLDQVKKLNASSEIAFARVKRPGRESLTMTSYKILSNSLAPGPAERRYPDSPPENVFANNITASVRMANNLMTLHIRILRPG